ncbi:enoyl-CoA hydratase / 3-hydroxyacyl-CoA dehydrogenase [Desulfacinum infernum DSM 9756]|uniref:enoyl-CoA hydratase n=1 Tax=Desulfacinum infernum DSM 9756 TaxID=1121391 RepID=A0A1M5G633_9BACT|nr:3-hydroxyacyl-CoA dehydrogenase/enoyl-CoA hydratase family protein [Desulfacinum infernum]SHF99280.1 enoyl-CoA hydratase / 3-hydroxyacyl-CoA dehydrogenase [Desulfacinum infernum DSM 9756]
MHGAMTIGVVGAGTMGSGIAQKLAQEGFRVVLVDVESRFVERGIGLIQSTLREAVKRKIFDEGRVAEILGRIHGTVDKSALKNADLVIEAVFEDEQVKKDLFRELDAICAPQTIFATNTSSFYVKDMAAVTSRPDRFVGMHYFYHPAKNRLLEVIPHEGTSRETLQKAVEIGRLHGKVVIVVKDVSGFAVNRFFSPLLTEAVQVLSEGWANIPTIEKAAKEAFGIGMGPFELMNVTGIPIAVHASTTFGRELGSLYGTPKLLRDQFESGELWDLEGDVDDTKIEAVQDRLYGACLGAAAALVSEGVASIEDTDRGAKVGLRWSRGPFEIMNDIGIDRAYRLVHAMTERYRDFAMPEILVRQRANGEPFRFRYVDYEVEGEVAYITINRPEALNALNEATVSQLAESFDQAEKDPGVNAVVIRGAGKAFVAGADIRFFIRKIQEGRIEDIVSFTRAGHDLLLRLENSPKLTIAQLDGLSMGGGSELALACQAVVATPAASMSFPETGIGIYPGLGGMIRTARRIGLELAKYYVFTGETISAQDALDLGLVSKLVPPHQVNESIRELISAGRPKDKYAKRDLPKRFQERARLCSAENVQRILQGDRPEGVSAELAERFMGRIARKAPLAVQKANELMDAQMGVEIPKAIEMELEALPYMFGTKDALIGLSSVGAAPPRFLGE